MSNSCNLKISYGTNVTNCYLKYLIDEEFDKETIYSDIKEFDDELDKKMHLIQSFPKKIIKNFKKCN